MAAIPIIGEVVGKVLDRILPDKVANDAAKANLAQLALSGELAQITGQLDIDKAEASSGNWMVAGWRPAIGWVCAMALLSQFIVRPYVLAFKPSAPIPSLDLSTLLTLIFAMLGIGIHEKLTS